MYYIILGIFGTLMGLTSSLLLKYHKLEKIEMVGFMTSLIIGSMVLHVMGEKTMNISRIFGVGLIAFGGYLLMRK